MESVAPNQPESISRDELPYPVEVRFDYRIMRAGEVLSSGRGTTLNISGSGILFKTDRPVPRGLEIEAHVDWPNARKNAITLQLFVQGETLATEEDGRIAIRVLQHEFQVANQNFGPVESAVLPPEVPGDGAADTSTGDTVSGLRGDHQEPCHDLAPASARSSSFRIRGPKKRCESHGAKRRSE